MAEGQEPRFLLEKGQGREQGKCFSFINFPVRKFNVIIILIAIPGLINAVSNKAPTAALLLS